MSFKNKIKFFKKLSRSKKWSVIRRKKPNHANIEICGHCNLDCIMCLRTSLKNRNQLMTLSEFKTILDHLPDLIFWSPHGYNEPLLHPRFLDFVKEASDRGIYLNLVTNGLLLTEEILQELLAYKVHKITFSIDGTGDRYEQIRKGGNWAIVRANLLLCGLIFDTEIHSTIWAGEHSNIDEIIELLEFAKGFKIPITFNDITTHEHGVATSENAIRFNVRKELLDMVDEAHNAPTVRMLLQQHEPRSCNLPWTGVYVDVTGDVYPCTDTLTHLMGNVLNVHISKLYKNEHYERFRGWSKAGNSIICRNCLAWGK